MDGAIEGAVTAASDASGAVLTLAEAGRIEGEVRAPVILLNGTLTAMSMPASGWNSGRPRGWKATSITPWWK